MGEQKCLHPTPGNEQCSGKVIEAHTISRNAALTKIAREHQVYQLDGNPFTIAKAEVIPPIDARVSSLSGSPFARDTGYVRTDSISIPSLSVLYLNSSQEIWADS
jgi:hypothetical protein